jgi:cysteine dioxygenase
MALADVSPIRLVSIDDFAAGLSRLAESAFEGTETLRRFLAEHPVDPATLDRYLFWDLQHYTRNLIAKTPLFELLSICWEIGQGSSIHNHREQNCWMSVPSGRLLVQNYRVLEQDLKAGTCRIEKTTIERMSPSNPVAVDPREPVHKVYNPRDFHTRAVSLHVYSRPFDTCDVYAEESGTCGTIGLQYTSIYGAPTGIRLG